MNSRNDIPTSVLPFVETEHGRLRRKQRGIDKKDLQQAMKYGRRRNGYPMKRTGHPTSKYMYNDITYIVNEVTGEEITSYAKPFSLDQVPVTEKMALEHFKAAKMVKNDYHCWKSNTVIVVDTSGSMKTSDVWGTRNRLAAVWAAIALDFVAHRIETGEASSMDVVSIVTMSEEPEVIVDQCPCTWLLYNAIVSVYEEKSIQPRGHGPFLPCLDVAHSLLTRNTTCPASLIFFSDGAPSDKIPAGGIVAREKQISDEIGDIASAFGRNLTFVAICIGDKETFPTLKSMVDTAKDFESKAVLQIPSLCSESIGTAITTSATSLLETKTELLEMGTSKQKRVRNVLRESRQKASETITTVSSDDFWIYPASDVKRRIYKEWYDGKQLKKTFERVKLQHPDARYVAFSKKPFGEGAERFAYRFFEVAKDGKTIVGKPLVAKESRYLIDEENFGDSEERKSFVNTFCRTQYLAKRLAEKFNNKMSLIKRIHPRTPRVDFLDCSIYEMYDLSLGSQSVLVEEKLDHHKWRKWNSNNGTVTKDGKVVGMIELELNKKYSRFVSNPLALDEFRLLANDLSPSRELGMLEEGSEEEESDEESSDGMNKRKEVIQPIIFGVDEVAQAFSHFSYKQSKKRLVCDLQGVYDEHLNKLMLSDPVIHYHDPIDCAKKYIHGRTDRGKKGIQDFFCTHAPHHGLLCSMMIRGLRDCKHQNSQPLQEPLPPLKIHNKLQNTTVQSQTNSSRIRSLISLGQRRSYTDYDEGYVDRVAF